MQLVEPVNILLVDDQPAKLISYEAVLKDLGENLIQAGSARQALELLLKTEVAVILIDVCMPDLDGFQLAEMIRDHPRFKKVAILFVSAVQFADVDHLRGYQLGAVDYVPVPVIPELLRAKVKVFAELYRKTSQLERLNKELEQRVAERTVDVEASNARLRMAVEIARLGTWDWNLHTGEVAWSGEQFAFLGYGRGEVVATAEAWLACLHPDDRPAVEAELQRTRETAEPYHQVSRVVTADGSIAWCEMRGQYELDETGGACRLRGVLMDISEHKLAAERQHLMLQELHHRVKNTLATVQAIATMTCRTTRDLDSFRRAFSGRLIALSKTHTMLVADNWSRIGIRDLLVSELGGFDDAKGGRVVMSGPPVELPSQVALSLGLAIHELTTNAAKYGSLSVPDGRLAVTWSDANSDRDSSTLHLRWQERNGPPVTEPTRQGFGSVLLKRLFDDQSGSQMRTVYGREGFDFDLVMPLVPPVEQQSTEPSLVQ